MLNIVKVLDRCFSVWNKKYTIEDLLEIVNNHHLRVRRFGLDHQVASVTRCPNCY